MPDPSMIPGTEMTFDAPMPQGQRGGQSAELAEAPKFSSTPMGKRSEAPKPIMDEMTSEVMDKFLIWIDQWILDLENAQAPLMNDWAAQEKAYRALPDLDLPFAPFEGSSNETIPVGAMAVDPIFARLDIGTFKQEPVFSFKPLRKDITHVMPSVERFVDYYQKHKLKLRQVAQPRLLEFVKLGTMVFKVIYDREEAEILGYEEGFKKVTKKIETRFAGPRVIGIHLGDFLFPPFYETIQDCPIVIERQRTTYEKLKAMETAGKLANVDKIKYQQTIGERTKIEAAREDASKHALRTFYENELKVYEIHCDFSVKEGSPPSHLVLTYHRDTRTVLQLRLNWYFHQKKPYVLAPYQVANDTMLGIGIMEMVKPLQDAITKWHRMAQDNAYIANIRMFIVRRDSGIEEVPRLYSGRCFFVDEPTKDFIPFAAGDIYPSTLAERQNLFGMVEKRTGASDYLTGRESPIIGTRATATSTLALIKEGLARVEEVLENVRQAFAEITEFVISLWIQYGTGDLETLVYGADDEVTKGVKQFFKMVNMENINGAFAVDLTVTDTATNKQAQQQMQLALIQVMMQYLEKVLEAGHSALEALKQGVPEYAEMVKEVMHAAREMFRDLAQKYDIPNPDDYLPDLERFINVRANGGAAPGQGGGGDGQGRAGGSQGEPSLPVGTGAYRGPTSAMPGQAGEGARRNVAERLAGAGSGVP